MQKYDIPSTEGAYNLSVSYTVMLCEKQSNDGVLSLKKYTLRWPEGMEELLTNFLDNLNDILQQRGLNLTWGYYNGNEIRQSISMQGMYFITRNVDVPKIAIDLNGKTYKVKVEKLQEFLKGLE